MLDDIFSSSKSSSNTSTRTFLRNLSLAFSISKSITYLSGGIAQGGVLPRRPKSPPRVIPAVAVHSLPRPNSIIRATGRSTSQDDDGADQRDDVDADTTDELLAMLSDAVTTRTVMKPDVRDAPVIKTAETDAYMLARSSTKRTTEHAADDIAEMMEQRRGSYSLAATGPEAPRLPISHTNTKDAEHDALLDMLADAGLSDLSAQPLAIRAGASQQQHQHQHPTLPSTLPIIYPPKDQQHIAQQKQRDAETDQLLALLSDL